MPDSDKLAIAAHLHVLLRRKTGRVTDTEWMAQNAEYACEIVRFSRLRAREDAAPELAEWADRLERAMRDAGAAPPARQPLREAAAHAAQAVRERISAAAPEPASASSPEPVRYVGGIR